MNIHTADRLLTTCGVAGFLGMSPESVLRRYGRGELPGYRLGSNVLRFRAIDGAHAGIVGRLDAIESTLEEAAKEAAQNV